MDITSWKTRAKRLKNEIHALYLAARDPRTPWYAKGLGACVIGYALSPIDLIPDPIPILGYLDDLILLPLGIAAVRKMIPKEVLAECRLKAQETSFQRKHKNWIAAAVIIVLWIIAAIWAFRWIFQIINWSPLG